MSEAIVWLPRALIVRMVTAAEDEGSVETGGMLIGYEGADRPAELVVTQLIEAGPRARRNEYAFHPDSRWQRRKLARIYEGSGRVETFLGDWHSHPHGLPIPSERDIETAAHIAANRRARAPRPLTVILGREDKDWVLAAFRFMSGDLVSARVTLFETEMPDMLTALKPGRPRTPAWKRTDQPPHESRWLPNGCFPGLGTELARARVDPVTPYRMICLI